MADSWTCPRCQSQQVVTAAAKACEDIELHVAPLGLYGLDATLVCCARAECGGYELVVKHGVLRQVPNSSMVPYGFADGSVAERLVPQSRARSYPEYVPLAVRNDYEEACAIERASPKAAATLARRALQGMIRDFWDISGKTNLFQEIEAIKGNVSPEVWDAIDVVRKIGNIGAHMERDINVIVEVEPSEAAALIGLIEMLIEEWYVAHHQRQERLAFVKQIGDEKDAAKSGAG